MKPALAVAACLAVLAAAAQGQRRRAGKKEGWRLDPYTRLDDAAREKAGYLSFGPFPWGDDHSSELIAQKMGEVRLLWVETPHFRIGSSLAPWRIETKNKQQGHRFRGELARLAARIPRLDAKRVRRMGPWLRLHLYAQRLEELWADFMGRLSKAPAGAMPPKFLVLMFQRHTSLERYLAVFLGMRTRYPRRYIFPKNAAPLFVTAADVQPGYLGDDRALHCHVVWNVVHNMVEAYKGHYYQLPVWWGEGLAHWYARRIDDAWSNYSQPPDVPAEMREREKWSRAVRGLVAHDNFTPFETMMDWVDYGRIKFKDHLVAWSRVDFLMQVGGDGFGVFMDGIKGLRDASGATIRGRAVLEHQREAFARAWSIEPADFDAKWTAWVGRRYPRK